ncbi:hypothetical protein [Paenibacillus ehimensis]|uniref:YhfM-like domain-containing protein n=1 Tax=Paenibacillus ehimensis TaxID=79264 RepID=A0ABT8VIG8_9BACL|nr:hypothetical protein [Paenibacillus ehimensis]MDO3680778.1 hypothetical protein [Paenibacillus ehimensis]MEC0213768.1 hypothetical protein [Paenibacillus ehimensis]
MNGWKARMRMAVVAALFGIGLLSACSHETGKDVAAGKRTWGQPHGIRAEDIASLIITDSSGNTSSIVSRDAIVQFLEAIQEATAEAAKLDIRPPDMTIALSLKDGREHPLYFWLAQNNDRLFVDLDRSAGYYTLTAEGKNMVLHLLDETRKSLNSRFYALGDRQVPNPAV